MNTIYDVIKATQGIAFGSTNTAAPIEAALKANMEVDVFISITDNETYAGGGHTFQVLEEYRRKVNPMARNIVIGVTSTGFTIADPNDPLSLDIVGGDASLLDIITSFVGITER